jgi:hypothetical protein
MTDKEAMVEFKNVYLVDLILWETKMN